MKKLIQLTPILLMIFGISISTQAQKHSKKDGTKIYALQFHADWCGHCRAMDPKIDELKTKARKDKVEFLRVDLTSNVTKSESRAKLDKLGLAEFFDSNSSTAYVLLVDAKTRQPITRLTGKQSTDEMYETLKEYL